jgi:predicted kinase
VTVLIVIRGNSGSGKSSVAREVRRRYGRGCALIEQDYLRRIMLREHDTTGLDGLAPQLIGANAKLALDHGYHVVLEGILFTGRYRPMLTELIAGHPGESYVYYLDVSLDETLRRHATRPLAADVTAEQMRGWYAPRDVLGLAQERVIDESSSFEQTVETILHTSALLGAPVLAPCPTRCPHCQAIRR